MGDGISRWGELKYLCVQKLCLYGVLGIAQSAHTHVE